MPATGQKLSNSNQKGVSSTTRKNQDPQLSQEKTQIQEHKSMERSSHSNQSMVDQSFLKTPDQRQMSDKKTSSLLEKEKRQVSRKSK